MSVESLLKSFEIAESAITDLKTEFDGLLDDLRRTKRELGQALLDVGFDEPLPGETSASTAHPSQAVADTVLAAARAEWQRPVKEPPGGGWERIDAYIRGSQGLGWDWEKAYTENQQFAWCGAFAAFVYGAAGLEANLRLKVLPSTYRLYKWAKGTARMIKPHDLRLGDIAIVGKETEKNWGSHVTICREIGSNSIGTYEGNASGFGPSGDRYEGVIIRERPLARPGLRATTRRVLFGVRPLAEDFVP